MSQQDHQVESRILSMVKSVLTQVARDTHTPPGMRHPLSDDTINAIRDCLNLITSREAELNGLDGRVSGANPRFVDEPANPSTAEGVVVTLDSSKPGSAD